jgi:hypothetical protein
MTVVELRRATIRRALESRGFALTLAPRVS